MGRNWDFLPTAGIMLLDMWVTDSGGTSSCSSLAFRWDHSPSQSKPQFPRRLSQNHPTELLPNDWPTKTVRWSKSLLLLSVAEFWKERLVTKTVSHPAGSSRHVYSAWELRPSPPLVWPDTNIWLVHGYKSPSQCLTEGLIHGEVYTPELLTGSAKAMQHWKAAHLGCVSFSLTLLLSLPYRLNQ